MAASTRRLRLLFSAACCTPQSAILLLLLLAHQLPAAVGEFYPPATVTGYDQVLTTCKVAGETSTITTTLAHLSRGGTRAVVVANYYTGCTGGRQEASEFAKVEIDATRRWGDKVLFVTNLVQSSTSTNCAGWLTFTNTDSDDPHFRPTILYSDKGGSSSVGSKHLSYTYFDNLHPLYMVVDGNLNTHFYESSNLPGPKFSYAPGTSSYEGGAVADSGCDGKDRLTYWNVGDCLYRGYDKVNASLAAHIATLQPVAAGSPATTNTPVTSTPSQSPSPADVEDAPSPAPSSEAAASVNETSDTDFINGTSGSSGVSNATSDVAPSSVPDPASPASPSPTNTPACTGPGPATVGPLDPAVAPLTCAPAFGQPSSTAAGDNDASSTTSVHVLATAAAGLFDTPRDLQFHPSNPNELWVANSGTADNSVLTFWAEPSAHATTGSFRAVRVADRAKYHYMASVSSLAFGVGGRFATCQESMNDYDGLTARGFPEGMGGNRFMGPSLFESDPARRVNSMGELCSSSELHDATELGPPNSKSECFLRHIDMLHESPLCMGIAHDPEQFSSCQGGHATVQQNVFWTFDGYGRPDQVPTADVPRRGMLMRYDFERDHGGCNEYLCADHGEAEVRRYEDVVLTRLPGVASHIVLGGGGHRDLWIADSGAGRLLRVDPDSGRVARTAIYEWPIYSSSHLHFNYKVWSCTTYEVFADANTPGLLTADAAEFVPSGVALGDDVVYVSNHATGNVIAFDVYTGEVVATVQTGRTRALAGLEVRTGAEGTQQLFVLDQVQGDLILLTAMGSGCGSDGGARVQRPRRPFPVNATSCDPDSPAFDAPTVGAAIEHDPGYMNIAIPYDYAGNSSVPCHDPTTGRSNFNLDALLMAGWTCHRCLPEPCRNGGVCSGVQEHGFSCTCPAGYDGDLCQRRTSSEENEVADAFEEAVDQQEDDEADAEPVTALENGGSFLGHATSRWQGGGVGSAITWLAAGAGVVALLASL